MFRHGAGRAILSSDQQTLLYTENLSDYQSFVADCYERKFNSIKQGFGNGRLFGSYKVCVGTFLIISYILLE